MKNTPLNERSRNRAIAFLMPCIAFLTAAGAAFPADEPVTEPEKCLLLGMPYEMGYLEGENKLLMMNGGGAYALDAASGQEYWHRYVGGYRSGRGVTFGQRKALGWSANGVFLLDIATGKETWSRDDPQCGPVQMAMMTPDEKQVLVTGNRGCLLYTMATHSKVALPRPEEAWFSGFLPGNEKLLFEKDEEVADKNTQKWLIMDASTGTMETGWEREVPRMRSTLLLSSLGQFSDAAPDEKENTTTLRILDAPTGKVLREFKGLAGQIPCMFWLQDAKRLYYTSKDKKQAVFLDSETGTVLMSFSQEGHRFVQKPYEDAAGTAWLFSRDDANNYYAWPAVTGGTPRKVLDGARVAPGYLYINDFCKNTILTRFMLEDKVWSYSLFSLDGMKKLGGWECGYTGRRGVNFLINRDKTHCVQLFPRSENDRYWGRNMAFDVFEKDNPKALYSGDGRPLAFSPDAKYLAVQTGDTTTCLYETGSERVLREVSIDPPADQTDFWAYMSAAFSEDGTLLAINTTQSIVVVATADGYAKWSLATVKDQGSEEPLFSPDATRILLGGYNYAWLFDANSGELLHTLEETERFTQRYSNSGGFWSGLARSAEDWVGTVTDRFKPGSYVQAGFVEDGKKVVTYTMGQVIRVWDADSGALLHTIRTELPQKRNKFGDINNEIALSPNNRFAFSFSMDNFGLASLWSVEDGALLRQYRLPDRENTWPQAAVLDDGSAVFFKQNENLYRWPGKKQP